MVTDAVTEKTLTGECRKERSSPKDLHYVAKSLLFAFPAISIGAQISTWIGFALSDMKNHVDFSVFYNAGLFVRSGQIENLYPNPPTFDFIHPAYEAPLFVPLTFLSPRCAYVAWIGVNLIVLSLLLWLIRRQLPNLSSISRVLPGALALAFFPIPYAMAQGQDSLLLAVLLSLSFLKFQKGDEFSAGVLLGFGAFRFQFLVPIGLLFLAWKLRKPVLGMISGGFCALLASIAVTGISGQVAYFKMLGLLAQPSNQHVHRMSNVRAVLFASGIESAPIVGFLSIAALILLAWLGSRCFRETTISDTCGNVWAPVLRISSQKLLFACAASCLLSYHLFLHDMSVLVIPLLILADVAILSSDYWTLGLLGVVILAPEVIILAGSANAMWACAVVPVLLLLALTYRPKALRNPAKHPQLHFS